jgi:threonine/homoserine/homoserine lactone efflux protein
MFLQGVLLGVSLSFLIGPLFFTVVQAGISQGFRAGIAVASGIWLSDMLFVAAILWGVDSFSVLAAQTEFKFWAGILGGLLLMAFGAGAYFSKRKKNDNDMEEAGHAFQLSYSHWWLRGFLINTINPGTIFFWLGIATAVVVPNHWSKRESLVFFGGMLGTLVVTDMLKAWAAKAIRRWLTPKHIRQVQKGIGILLFLIGLAVIFKAFSSSPPTNYGLE